MKNTELLAAVKNGQYAKRAEIMGITLDWEQIESEIKEDKIPARFAGESFDSFSGSMFGVGGNTVSVESLTEGQVLAYMAEIETGIEENVYREFLRRTPETTIHALVAALESLEMVSAWVEPKVKICEHEVCKSALESDWRIANKND